MKPVPAQFIHTVLLFNLLLSYLLRNYGKLLFGISVHIWSCFIYIFFIVCWFCWLISLAYSKLKDRLFYDSVFVSLSFTNSETETHFLCLMKLDKRYQLVCKWNKCNQIEEILRHLFNFLGKFRSCHFCILFYSWWLKKLYF